MNYTVIFKMSENGSECIDFLKYCNNKGPTLTIIETKNNNIFGGFTPLNWNIPDNYNFNKLIERTKKTFLFSMNLMKKYDILNRDLVAIGQANHIISFGNADIWFNKNTLRQGFVSAFKNSNFFEYMKLELTNGKGERESFDTKEIEVFKVI